MKEVETGESVYSVLTILDTLTVGLLDHWQLCVCW